MPCINLDLEYFSHRKVLRLCAKLGTWAEILPLKLWTYTGKFHPENGLLIGYSADELITMIGVRPGCNKDASSILQALLDCGFLVTAEGGYQVHQWLEYQGHIAAFSIRGKTAAKKRWSKLKGFSHNDATSMPDAMLNNDSSNTPTDLILSYLAPVAKTKEEESPESSGLVPPLVNQKKKKEFADDSIETEAAKFFWSYLKDWSPTAKEPNAARYQSWAKDFDMIMRVDKRTALEINELLDWINTQKESKNGFSWRKNIQSPGTLRLRWNEGKFADFLPSTLSKDEYK